MTICIQIGNIDDKLSQKDWSTFARRINEHCAQWSSAIHFMGGSASTAQWQNACWVVECTEEEAAHLKNSILATRQTFGQESAAWLEGETKFI